MEGEKTETVENNLETTRNSSSQQQDESATEEAITENQTEAQKNDVTNNPVKCDSVENNKEQEKEEITQDLEKEPKVHLNFKEGNENPSKIDGSSSSSKTKQEKEKVVESDKKDVDASSSLSKKDHTSTTTVTKETTTSENNLETTTLSVAAITTTKSDSQLACSTPVKSEEEPSTTGIVSSPSTSLSNKEPNKEPKIIKKGDRVIKAYVDEKTGKINVYEPGIKLEVGDFKGSWYPAKVMEVDHEENEVLVHYDKWSSRFDEWIKMDSNRLRPTSDTNVVKIEFKVGEKVEAVWSMDGNKYPGVIQAKLPNDYYEILFEDGFKCKKKSNQIFKLQRITRRRAALEQEKSKPSKGSSRIVSTPTTITSSPASYTSTSPLNNIDTMKSRLKLPNTSSFTNSNASFTTSPHSILKSTTNSSTTTTKNDSTIRRQTLPSSLSTPPSSPVGGSSPNINAALSTPIQHLSLSTYPLHSSPHHSIFEVPEDLGKRKRASYDYSLFIKNPRKPRGSSTEDTAAVEKVVVSRRSRKSKIEIDGTDFVQGTITQQDETRQDDKNKINIKAEFNSTITTPAVVVDNSGQTTTNITPTTTVTKGSTKRNRESSLKILETTTTTTTESEKIPKLQRKSWSRRPPPALVSQTMTTEYQQQQQMSMAEQQQPEVTGFVDSQGNTVAVEQTSDGGWICPVDKCGKQFRKDSLLHSHLKYYHPDEKIQYRGRKLMNVVESAQARAAFEYEETKPLEKEIPYIIPPLLPPPPPPSSSRSQLSSSQASSSSTTVQQQQQQPSIVVESLGNQQGNRQNENLLKTGRRKGTFSPTTTPITTIPTTTGTCLTTNNNNNDNTATNVPSPSRVSSVTEIEALSLVFESSGGKSNSLNTSSSHQDQVEVKVEELETISPIKNETTSKESPVASPSTSSTTTPPPKIQKEETSILLKSHSSKSESKTSHHHHHHHHHHHNKSKFQTKNVRVLLEKMNLKKLQQQAKLIKIQKTKPHRVSQRGRTLAPTRWNRLYHDNDSWDEDEEDSDLGVSSGDDEDVDSDLSPKSHKSSILIGKKLPPSPLSLLSSSSTTTTTTTTAPPTTKQQQMSVPSSSSSPSIVKEEKMSEDEDESETDDEEEEEEQEEEEEDESETDEEEEEEQQEGDELEGDEYDENEEDKSEINATVSMDYSSINTSDSIIMDIDEDDETFVEKAGRRMRRRATRHALSWSISNRKRTTSSSITVSSPTAAISKTGKDTCYSGYNRQQLKYIERQLFKNGQKKKLSFTPKSEDVCVDIINCECGIGEEFGLMMQCENCQSWQHGPCYEIQEKDQMPQYYVCSFCRDTTRLRSSFKDEWSQEINKTGRLPTLSTSPSVSSNMEKKMKTCNDLMRRLEVIRDCLRSTQIKIGLFNSPTEDPKLYRWHKVPTAPWTDVQNYQFSRHYRGLLRRLLRQNRDDPDYVKKLRERIASYQTTQVSRLEDEKVLEAIKKRFNSRAWKMIEQMKGNLELEQAQQQEAQLQQQQKQQLEGGLDTISFSNGELLLSNNLNNNNMIPNNNNGDNLLPVNGFEFDSDSDISLKSFFPFDSSSFYSTPENLLSSPLLLSSSNGNGNNSLNNNNNNNNGILNNITNNNNSNNNDVPPLLPSFTTTKTTITTATTTVNPNEEPGTSKQIIVEETIKKIKLGLQNKLNEEHYPLFETKTESSTSCRGFKELKYLLLAQDTGSGEKVGDIVPVAQKFQLSDGRIIKKVVSIGKIVTKTEGNLFVIRLIDPETLESMDYTENIEDFKPQFPAVNTELLNQLKLCRPCKKTFNVNWNLKDFVKNENILLVPESRQQQQPVVSTMNVASSLPLLKEISSQPGLNINDNNQIQEEKKETDTIKTETLPESSLRLQNSTTTIISATDEISSVEIPIDSSTLDEQQLAGYLLDDDDNGGSSSPDSSEGGFKMPERITTESCRMNLHADIVKQQALLDLHLDMIEDKLKSLEQSKKVNDPQVIMRKLKDLEELKRKVHRINSNISFMNKLQKNLEEPDEMSEN